MENDSKHALVIPLFGELQRECMYRLNAWMHHGFWVVVVNNNPVGSSMRGVCANTIVYNHNHQGLAGGLNAGVTAAVADGARCITLLDQDSIISVESQGIWQGMWSGRSYSPHLTVDSSNKSHTSLR